LKYVTLLAAVLVLAIRGAAAGTEIVAFDGVWWQSLTRQQQLVAVAGMLSGYEAGYAQGNLDDQKARASQNSVNAKSRAATVERIIAGAHTGSDFSFTTIADRISAVYRDHPKLVRFPVSLFYRCAMIEPEGCEGTTQKDETDLRSGPVIP